MPRFPLSTSTVAARLTQTIEEGKIRSIVDRIYPMEQAAEAHRRVETEQRIGAVVIAIG